MVSPLNNCLGPTARFAQTYMYDHKSDQKTATVCKSWVRNVWKTCLFVMQPFHILYTSFESLTFTTALPGLTVDRHGYVSIRRRSHGNNEKTQFSVILRRKNKTNIHEGDQSRRTSNRSGRGGVFTLLLVKLLHVLGARLWEAQVEIADWTFNVCCTMHAPMLGLLSIAFSAVQITYGTLKHQMVQMIPRVLAISSSVARNRCILTEG